MNATQELPLFPLRTVLFPGGLLPLRIFEPRYVDMVGRCMRNGEVFGVVLIESGAETAGPVDTAMVGTTARIVDFQTLPDGLLGLLCRGEQRFRIVTRRVQSDRLHCASVEWLAAAAGTGRAGISAAGAGAARMSGEPGTDGRFSRAALRGCGLGGSALRGTAAARARAAAAAARARGSEQCLRLLAPMIEAKP